MEEIGVQMSRTLLYTGHDTAYQPLADITVPRMREYAKWHGMKFECYTAPMLDVPNGIYWTGVCGALSAFKAGYDRAVYLDCDQLLTNFDWEIPEEWVNGFHASKDWGNDAIEPWHFSACGFIANRDCIPMLETVLDMEPEWREKPFQEQGPWQEWLRLHQWHQKEEPTITIHPRRTFNAVPDQIAPGNVPEPWQPGDWCAHLTMVPLERRIEIANEVLAQL